MVWWVICSHVEGVEGRQHRVWIAGRPLAPASVAVAVLCERVYTLHWVWGKAEDACFRSSTLTPPVE